MKSNIIVLQFPKCAGEEESLEGQNNLSLSYIENSEVVYEGLPCDSHRKERKMTSTEYVAIISSALLLDKSVAIGRHFNLLQNPYCANTEPVIDLWPVQFSNRKSKYPETFTLVLQMGTILHMTHYWKKLRMRVNIFVDDKTSMLAEKSKVTEMLMKLRIVAELNVVSLDEMYEKDENVCWTALDIEMQAKVLNSLIRKYSRNSRVVFTGLPSPPNQGRVGSSFSSQDNVSSDNFYIQESSEEGSSKSDLFDVRLADAYLEVINEISNDTPPILMIHGNGVVVTTDL